jgi:hypothetical protein
VPKIVFIAHPMSGDIQGNTEKVVDICRSIHSDEVIPLFPSFTTRRYLTDDPTHRAWAKAHIHEYFRRKIPDELWLFGDRITDGMKREIALAREYWIPVFAKTPETQAAMKALKL